MRRLLTCSLLFLGLTFPISSQAQEKSIRINYADAYPPLSSGYGVDVKGVLPALLDYVIAQHMGYNVKHNGTAWKRAQMEVWRGDADALITSVNPQRLEYSDASLQSIFTLTFRPFTKKGSAASKALEANPPIESLSNFRFCDVHGNLWGKNFYEKHNINFYVARSFQICLKLLQADRTDIIIHSDHILMDIIHRNNMEDDIEAHPQIMPESPDFYFLLSKKSKLPPSFLKEFNSTVSNLKSDGSYQRFLTQLNMENGMIVALTIP